MTIPILIVMTPPWYAAIPDLLYVLAVPVLLNKWCCCINNSLASGMWGVRSRSLSFKCAGLWSAVKNMRLYNESTRLLVGKLGHTGLVPFVDKLGTGCGEVPLEYGFEVLVWNKHCVCFLQVMHDCLILSLSLAPSMSTGFKLTLVSDNSVMCDTMNLKLISIWFGTLCWLPSRLPVPCSLASRWSGEALLD